MAGIGRKMVHGKFDVSEGLQRAGHVDVPPIPFGDVQLHARARRRAARPRPVRADRSTRHTIARPPKQPKKQNEVRAMRPVSGFGSPADPSIWPGGFASLGYPKFALIVPDAPV